MGTRWTLGGHTTDTRWTQRWTHDGHCENTTVCARPGTNNSTTKQVPKVTYVSSCFCSVHRVSIVVSIVRPPSVHRCVRRRVVSSWPSDVFVLMAGLLRVFSEEFRLTSRQLHTIPLLSVRRRSLGTAGSITSYRAAPRYLVLQQSG